MYSRITGNVVADATSKTFPSGSTVINFTVAENTSYTNKQGKKVEDTEFVDCSYWKDDVSMEELSKGKWIDIAGFVGKRSYIRGEGTPEQKAVGILTLSVQEIVFRKQGKQPVEALVGSPGEPVDDLPF